MPRAPSGLSLLLMAGLAFAAAPPLDVVSRWLSTGDIQQPEQQQQQPPSTRTTHQHSHQQHLFQIHPAAILLQQAAVVDMPSNRCPKTTTTTKITTTTSKSTTTKSNSTISTTTTINTTTTTTTNSTNTSNNNKQQQQTMTTQPTQPPMRATYADLGPSCPPPCPTNNSTKSTTTQCLYYLQESHKDEVCDPVIGSERRRDILHRLRMRHCCEHAVDTALPTDVLKGGADCRRYVDALLAVDALVATIACDQAQVLTRYDCGQTYSIVHDCNHCKETYRRWVCSSLVPHYTHTGIRIRPCLSVCQDVEQQCPYLLPGDWTNQTVPPGEMAHPTPQYAGEPTFLCLDPNIPETGEQRSKSLRGDEDCCYTHCGTPGRGGVGGTEYLGVCEHCPGRPENLKQPSPSSSASSASTSNLINAKSASNNFKTFIKVFNRWTAWIFLIYYVNAQTYLLSITYLNVC